MVDKDRHLSPSIAGYYDVPQKVSSQEVSRHLNIDKSTFVEHLRKAEREIIAQVKAK